MVNATRCGAKRHCVSRKMVRAWSSCRVVSEGSDWGLGWSGEGILLGKVWLDFVAGWWMDRWMDVLNR